MNKKAKLMARLCPLATKLDKLMLKKDKRLPRYSITNINKDNSHCTVTCMLDDFNICETVNADDKPQGREIVASKILYMLKERGIDHDETRRKFNNQTY